MWSSTQSTRASLKWVSRTLYRIETSHHSCHEIPEKPDSKRFFTRLHTNGVGVWRWNEAMNQLVRNWDDYSARLQTTTRCDFLHRVMMIVQRKISSRFVTQILIECRPRLSHPRIKTPSTKKPLHSRLDSWKCVNNRQLRSNTRKSFIIVRPSG